jgi:DNA-directed RNA polymerase sigma subunit (sigma70/sigma32)
LNETLPKPLREIAETFEVTESRISQLRKTAIAKIRRFIYDQQGMGKGLGETKTKRVRVSRKKSGG